MVVGIENKMNPNLMERFLGPSTDFFLFNQNDANISVTPIEKKTCLLTKRNVIATTIATSAALKVINNCTKTNPGTKKNNPSYSTSRLKPYNGSKTSESIIFLDIDEPEDFQNNSHQQKKLSSSSYTIISDNDNKTNNITLPDIFSENNLLNNEVGRINNLDEKSDKTLNMEDYKSTEDSSLISELNSDIEDCKFHERIILF